MKLLPNTLAFRLTFWYTLVVIILITIAFNASYFLLSKALDHDMEQDLIEDIGEFRTLYQKAGLAGVKQEINRDLMKSGEEERIFFQLFNQQGERMYSSDLSYWAFLPDSRDWVKRVISSEQVIFQAMVMPEEEVEVKAAYGLIAPGLVLYFGESTEDTQELMELLSQVFIAMLLMAIPFASMVSWVVAGRSVKGIKEVSRIASAIEKGNLQRRVSVLSQGSEISQLVDTFNAMLDRIWLLISEMKEMTDNIAHDLRSPLARIRMISESVLSNENTPQDFKTAASDTIEECDRLLQIINSSLDVAEAEAGVLQAPKTQVNVSGLVQDACELFEIMAEQKDISLLCRLATDCYIQGEAQSLQRMLANLIDNAIKYTQAEGKVVVELSRDCQQIEISVSDTGIGIPEGDQARVFDRFFRCDQSRTLDGCGLGLSYSRAVAHSHGGDILLNSSEQGSQFTIQLPI